MNFRYLFFDLDGTLIESGPGILASAGCALTGLGRECPDAEQGRRMIGPPLSWSFRELFGLSEEETEEAIRLYRIHYESEGMLIGSVYDGVRELLKELSDRGIFLGLATAKPLPVAKRVLAHFGLISFFSAAKGGNDGPLGGDKKRILSELMAEAGIDDLSSCLMVGDRCYDIKGAAELGMKSVGVTYGYGSREELTEAGADYVVSDPREILSLL